jgi:hypothetical protein
MEFERNVSDPFHSGFCVFVESDDFLLVRFRRMSLAAIAAGGAFAIQPPNDAIADVTNGCRNYGEGDQFLRCDGHVHL